MTILAPAVTVFDLGEVLSSPVTLFAELADQLVPDPPASAGSRHQLEAAYWRYRDSYDRGSSAADYWTAVLRDCGHDAGAAQVSALSRVDAHHWSTIRPDAQELLAHLHGAGVRVAILSNAPTEVAAAARASAWAASVDDWFFSAELHMAKPDPELYEHVTTALGVPADAVVFFDDREVNVLQARTAGWRAHLWASGPSTAALLASLNLI